MKPLTKHILSGLAVAIIMALLYGAKEVTFVAYGADRKADANTARLVKTEANTRRAADKAQEAADTAIRVDERTKAILEALQDIQRRLP